MARWNPLDGIEPIDWKGINGMEITADELIDVRAFVGEFGPLIGELYDARLCDIVSQVERGEPLRGLIGDVDGEKIAEISDISRLATK